MCHTDRLAKFGKLSTGHYGNNKEHPNIEMIVDKTGEAVIMKLVEEGRFLPIELLKVDRDDMHLEYTLKEPIILETTLGKVKITKLRGYTGDPEHMRVISKNYISFINNSKNKPK